MYARETGNQGGSSVVVVVVVLQQYKSSHVRHTEYRISR